MTTTDNQPMIGGTSNPPQDSKVGDPNNGLMTVSGAKAKGLTWSVEPPPSTQCQFCGATLEPDGVALFGRIIMWRPNNIPIRCTCNGSQEYWKQYDAEQERLKKEKAKEEERRLRIAKIKQLMDDCGMGVRFRNRTFSKFLRNTPDREKCFNLAWDYSQRFEEHREHGRGLYFEGTNGTGKTHLAAAITLSLISRHIPVVFKTCDDMLSDIKKAFDSKDKRDQEVIDIYKNVDLLVIDDLGKEQCTDWSMSALYQIINSRYENMKPIIVTTNYSGDGLVKALTPKGSDDTKIRAIISRLYEMSMPITMVWADIRRNN